MSEPSHGYNEQQHGGMQVLPWDGLILNVPTPGLEVVQDVSDTEKQPFPTTTAVNEASIGKDIIQEELNRAEKKPRVSRKYLWILIAVLLLIITAAVGGGVGGGIAKEHKSSSLTSGSPPPSTSSLRQQSSTSTASSPANTVFWGEDKGINIGCYIDDSDRFLTGPFFTDASSITPQLCAGLCSKYTYFGLEYGNQCFCGNVLTSGHSRTSYSDCNISCSGISNELCGGVWRIDVYQLTSTSPPVKSYNALGCHSDGIPRIMQGPEYQNEWMTPQLCAGLCNGYKYFGVEYGDQCFCGNEHNSTYTQETGSECNYLCAGDSSQMCGGFFTLFLYSFD